MLVFDFYATGATQFSQPNLIVDQETDLTLLPMLQDLRQR